MIVVSADEIATAIAGNIELLREMQRFLEMADMGNDLGALLDTLPVAVAACAPFTDEGALTATVRRETLLALHRLALARLPARGRA